MDCTSDTDPFTRLQSPRPSLILNGDRTASPHPPVLRPIESADRSPPPATLLHLLFDLLRMRLLDIDTAPFSG